MADREYCYKEQAFFPSGEFDDDPIVGRVHRTPNPHTVTGDDLDAAGPLPVTDPIEGVRRPDRRVKFDEPLPGPSTARTS